jgi:hypothetical protein
MGLRGRLVPDSPGVSWPVPETLVTLPKLGMRGDGEGGAMNGQPVISVRGEASLEVEPEIAIVEVTIQARDRDRRTVLGRLASRNQQVTDLIKSHGEAVEKLESGPASVRPDFRDKKASERIGGYLGRASVRITVRDFTVLGELVTGLSDEDLVTVAGPWWALRPDSPVYRAARLAAARDAMVRAREYAEAFGGEITGLIEAADAGLLTSPGERGSGFRTMAVGRAASGGGLPEAELDFEPARQTVTAQVEARFALTSPPPEHTSDHH